MIDIVVTIDRNGSLGGVIVIAAVRGPHGPMILFDDQSGVGLLQSRDNLESRLKKINFMGDVGQTALLDVSEFGSASSVLAVGVGENEDGSAASADRLRECAGVALRRLRYAETITMAIPAPTAEAIEALILGAYLGAYEYRDPTQSNQSGVRQQSIFIGCADTDESRGAIRRARLIGTEINTVRDLVNAPPNRLTPDAFVDLARARAMEQGLSFEALREPEISALGLGGLSAVGSGSSFSPALIRIGYTHPAAETRVAVVGKGITYDSGGISLKPVGRNEIMKIDMAGAAAALGALCAASHLGLVVEMTVWLVVAENMPSGTSMRPGDVLSMYDGTTVEVVNTDAEGRLVLADGIARAVEDGPDVVVDIATLTGEMMSALGARTIGIMSNDDSLLASLRGVAERAGEACWPMPILEDVRAGLKSPVADLANMGHRLGGGIAAGLFLQHFVPRGIGWIHMDIAGPSYNEGEPHGFTPKGATGSGVRILVALVEALAQDLA